MSSTDLIHFSVNFEGEPCLSFCSLFDWTHLIHDINFLICIKFSFLGAGSCLSSLLSVDFFSHFLIDSSSISSRIFLSIVSRICFIYQRPCTFIFLGIFLVFFSFTISSFFGVFVSVFFSSFGVTFFSFLAFLGLIHQGILTSLIDYKVRFISFYYYPYLSTHF